MSDIAWQKHIAVNLESNLQVFFSTPLLERLEKAKELFRFNDSDLFGIFEKYSDSVKGDLKDKTDEEKSAYLSGSNENLSIYTDVQCQHIFYYLPYFLWASHLILNRTHSDLTYSFKEELRDNFNLNTPKKRRDFFIGLFSRFVDEEVKDGGSDTHWNKWTRLLFLSNYERFLVVIENARKDFERLKNINPAVMGNKKEIVEKYEIPEDCWNHVFKQGRKDKYARRWAKERMLEQFDKKYIEKMGFSDSYLIKVLTKARDEAKQYIPCNCKNYDNHKLIFLNFGDPNLITNTYKPKSESKDIEIKFNTFYKKKSPGMELYFL